MKALRLATIAAFLGILQLTRAWGDPAPAVQPAASVGEVRVQTLKGYSYAYVSTQTTLNKIQDAISLLLPKIDAAMDSGALRPVGPVVFTYHGVTGQRDTPFTLDIGIIVKDKGTKPDGFQMDAVPAEQCATVIYSGPVSQVQQAYAKLFGEIGRRGLQPTGVTREVYLYWEDDGSENNIVQIQAVLPSAPGN